MLSQYLSICSGNFIQIDNGKLIWPLLKLSHFGSQTSRISGHNLSTRHILEIRWSIKIIVWWARVMGAAPERTHLLCFTSSALTFDNSAASQWPGWYGYLWSTVSAGAKSGPVACQEVGHHEHILRSSLVNFSAQHTSDWGSGPTSAHDNLCPVVCIE